jgi:hypothetical protein
MDELGPSVGAIADHLGAIGARGRPGDEERCVLNTYLRAVVGAEPAVVGVAVRPQCVRVRVDRWRPAVKVPLSFEAQSFIAAFDAGYYPELMMDAEAEQSSRSRSSPDRTAPGVLASDEGRG